MRRPLLVGGGALAMALTGVVSVASFNGVDIADAAVARAQSLADLMAQRSPGERTTAQLTKTKHRHFAVLAAREQPEALPPAAIEKPLVEALLPPAAAPLIPETLPVLAQTAPPVPAVFAPAIGGAVFAPGGFGGGGGGGAGGGGGGGGGPPAQPPTTQPPQAPPPAVPEPASWAMMIAGFGLTGLMLRRRRPRSDYPSLDH